MGRPFSGFDIIGKLSYNIRTEREKDVVCFMDTRHSSLIDGSIWKAMLLFAMPVFLGNLLQQFYNAFDSWAVGRFIGGTALAAVSSSGSLVFMMLSFFNGVALGGGVVIANLYGARNFGEMRRVIHTEILFGLVAGAFLTVFGVALTPVILGWMGTPESVLPQSIRYFRFYSYGIVFSVMYNIFVGILHAVGDSRHPLIFLMVSSAVNVGLDLLFVAVFKLGVGAAAAATTISQGISALLCCIHLLRAKEEPYGVRWQELRFHRKSLMDILRFGLPSGVQNSVIALANVVVQSNINAFDAAAIAGCGAYSKLEGFAFLPITCFTQALSTFVGQNLGAHQYGRVKKGVAFGVGCSVILAELIGVTAYLLAPQLIGIFNDQPEVVDFGTRHMRTICLFYCLLALSHCIASIMRGAGKATVPMVTMLLCWCVIRVGYITVAVRYVPELETVSRAYPITWTCSSIVFLIYFFKADWIHNFDRLEEKRKRA